MSLIEVSHLSFAYEGSYDNIFENVSFQLDSKSQIASLTTRLAHSLMENRPRLCWPLCS
jgi:ABC-type taurine transport system ATPase subunit